MDWQIMERLHPLSNLEDPQTLHVITCISNPVRYQSRYKLYREFAEHMRESGVHLITVEHAFGERPFEVTRADNPDHLQIRGGQNHELWLKESLINLGVRRLPAHWKYLAWIDADVRFLNKNWATETLHELQHYSVLQPWSHSIDVGPKGEILENEWGNDVDRSYCAAWDSGMFDPGQNYGNKDWRSHFGYAWACRREAYDAMGGLIDWLVVGSADYHMALGFGGQLRQHVADKCHDMSPGYKRRLLVFADRCDQHIRGNLGSVKGGILHGWHGRKKQRQYVSRHSINRDSGFDPDHDLVSDWQGLPVLTGNNLLLRDGLRKFFRARNEDSIDVI